MQNKYFLHSSFQAWLIVLTSALFFFYEFVQLNIFNVINNDLMQAFGVGATGVSNLSAGYFYADVILLLPAGMILDRFSVRTVLSIAMVFSIIGTFGLSLSHDYWLAFIMRLFSGFGAAFNLLSSLKLASRWFPEAKLSLVTGVVVTMAMIGGVISQTPMSLLSDAVGWRHALQIDGSMGIIFLLLIITIVRDFPKGSIDKLSRDISAGFMLKKVLSNGQNTLAAFYTSLMNLPILIFAALWGIDYLTKVDGFTATQASLMTSMIFIGMIIGCPLVGELADKLKRKKGLMIITGLLALVTILLMRYLAAPSLSQMLLLNFFLGLFISGQVLSYPLITEKNPHALTGSALGYASVIIMLGGALGQPLMGFLLDMHASNGDYTVSDYQFAFMIFPALFVVGIFCAFFLKEGKD
jgi:MFS family permease